MARVVIFGGGIGGLSAAHELVERGYQVAVYEQREICGGKARSYGAPGSGTGGRKDVPAEHGFRLFPGFYKHLPDTMKRIPFRDNPNGVFDNLITASQMELAREGKPPLVADVHYPGSVAEWTTALQAFFGMSELEVPFAEAKFFGEKLLTILTSCRERRVAEYERIPWWKFVEADSRSYAYRTLLATGLTRTLVAMRAHQASTRTVGNIGIQLMLNMLTPGQTSDRLLNGPTNEVWIDPWVSHLSAGGVELHLNASLQRLNLEGGRIRSATLQCENVEREVSGDYYICAFPVEVMRRIATAELKQAAPSLAHLDHLYTAWMIGMQFFLKRDVPVVYGHVIYADAKWALTSVSQHQFWRDVDLSEYGNGEVRGILSVDISDWHTPGNKVVSKPADQCTADEIAAEVWAQIKAHLNRDGQEQLQDADLLAWHLDSDIRFPRSLPQDERDVEPLLVNTAGSWQYRPEADLSNGLFREIPNLFLAADYVRTHTDLATMEGANEAARRAVNAILVASGSRAQPCGVWPLEEPALFAPFRAYDYTRFKLGYPHALPALAQAKKGLPALGRLTGGRGRERLRELNHYQFEERWQVEAPREAVWPLVAEPTTYPDWWRQFPEVRRLNDIQGLGAVWELQVRSGLPYQLRFVVELIRREEPALVEWRAEGDLVGRMGFRLQEAENGTEVIYTSDLRTTKPLVNALAPLAKKLFVSNHESMMRQGEAELQAELLRRSVGRGRGESISGSGRLISPGQGKAVWAASSRVTFKAVGQDTGGAYSLFEVEDAPQSGPPAHLFYRTAGAAYVLGGNYELQVGDSVFTATAGSFVFLPRCVWHDWKNIGAGPGKLLLITAPSGVEGYFEEVSRLPPGPPNVAELTAIGRKFGTEVRMPAREDGWLPTAAVKSNSPKAGLLLAPGQGASFQALGSRFTFKATGRDTGGAYSLCEVRDPPQGGQPPHRFRSIDGAAYVLEGNYRFQVGDETFTAPPGSLVLMPRGVWHHWKNVGSTPGRVMELAAPSGFENLIAEVAQLPPGPPDAGKLMAISQRYDAEVRLPSA